MELVASRGKLNGDPGKYPVIQKGVSLAMGSSYVKNAFMYKLGPGETQESSADQYHRSDQEVPSGYEPSMDIYIAWCNALVRDSKHLQGRVYFTRNGREHVFMGGKNDYQVFEIGSGHD